MSRLEAALAELADAIREEVRAELGNGHGGPDRLYSVDEAAQALSLGRTSVYQLMAAGRLRSVHAGRRRLIPSSAIAQFGADGSTP